MIIAITNSKGGTGKSTLTAQLAIRAAQDGQPVAIIDADPQGSLRVFFSIRHEEVGLDETGRENPALFDGDEDEVADAIQALREQGYDIIFIDTAPFSLSAIRKAVEVSDYVLIPSKSSLADLVSTNDAVVIAREAEKAHGVAFNDVDSRARHRKIVDEARKAVKATNATLLDAEVFHRHTFVEAMDGGRSVTEIRKSADQKGAVEDIDKLWLEISAALKKALRRTKP